MTVIAEDITFSIGEDVSFALPMITEATGGDIAEWLASAGLSEADIEADVGTWLSNMGSGALNFGTAGASIGGPWGALIGGLLGAGLGAVQSATTPDKPPATPPPAKPPTTSAPPPPAKPPAASSQSQPDMTTVLNTIRDLMPALNAIAQQMSRPKGESAEDEAEAADVAVPEVAEDWSLEQDWPYAQEGVEVATAEGTETEQAETEQSETEEAETEAEHEQSVAPETEQLVPEGEAYAGAALARVGEEEQEEADVS